MFAAPRPSLVVSTPPTIPMRTADNVYTDQVDIDRLQARLLELPNGQPVALTMRDGAVIQGVVAFRPSIQQFFDLNGREGSNAIVRIEEMALEQPMKAGVVDIFLDDIVRIRHLDRQELQPLRHAQTGAPAGSRPPGPGPAFRAPPD